MELVVNWTGMFHSFSNEWRVKWVQTIMMHCKSLKRKKTVAQAIATSSNCNTGIFMSSITLTLYSWSFFNLDAANEEKFALSLLVLLFTGSKKAESSTLCYLYDKYLVCKLSM